MLRISSTPRGDILRPCRQTDSTVARRRGWGGEPPRNDEEATARILDAAVKLIARTGSSITIADVAAELGVIRQTVYRYFPTADALMHAAAMASVDEFLARLAETVSGIADPAEAMTEAMMFALEEVARIPHLAILLFEPYEHARPGSVASDEAQDFGMRMINRFDVDWPRHGYDEAALRDLVEFTLRTLVSFFVAPNPPGRSREDLRNFIRRWLGAAISAQP